MWTYLGFFIFIFLVTIVLFVLLKVLIVERKPELINYIINEYLILCTIYMRQQVNITLF